MNILFSLPDLHVGGASSLLVQSIRALQDAHQVHIVYFGSNAAMLSKFLESGVDITRIPYNSPADFFSASRGLRKLIRQKRIDVVHCNLIFDKTIVCFATAGMNVKRVGTLHTAGRTGRQLFKQRNAVRLESWLHRRLFNHSICVSEASFKYWTHVNNLDPDKVSVVYNGIRQLQRSHEVPEVASRFVGRFSVVFGTACRFHYVKGIPRLLRVFAKVKETNPGVGLLLIGDGGHRHEIEKTIEENNLGDSVFITGFTDNVASYLDRIDYYVNASFIEAMPVSIIEALSLGKPVIASNVGGVPEIIFNSVNGYLVNFEDVLETALKFNQVLSEHNENYQRLSEAATRVFTEKFSDATYARDLSAIYTSLMSKP